MHSDHSDMKEITGQLQSIDLFKTMEASDLEALIASMQEETCPEGTVLFQAGDAGDTMYIIRSGRIRIYTHDLNARQITLTHHGQNEIFGELSLIDQRPRSASAAVVETLKVFTLRREDLLKLLNDRPQIGLAMIRSLTHLLRNTTTYLEEFHPERFVPPTEDHGEEFRRAATGLMASIIDGIDTSEETGSPLKKSENGMAQKNIKKPDENRAAQENSNNTDSESTV